MIPIALPVGAIGATDKSKPRFWCAVPGCQGVLPSGSNLWQHAEEHLERQAQELDAWSEQERRRIERRAARMGLALRRREP